MPEIKEPQRNRAERPFNNIVMGRKELDRKTKGNYHYCIDIITAKEGNRKGFGEEKKIEEEVEGRRVKERGRGRGRRRSQRKRARESPQGIRKPQEYSFYLNCGL